MVPGSKRGGDVSRHQALMNTYYALVKNTDLLGTEVLVEHPSPALEPQSELVSLEQGGASKQRRPLHHRERPSSIFSPSGGTGLQVRSAPP